MSTRESLKMYFSEVPVGTRFSYGSGYNCWYVKKSENHAENIRTGRRPGFLDHWKVTVDLEDLPSRSLERGAQKCTQN